MDRALATIQKIKSLEPINGADNIELCTFEDVAWQVVVNKNIHTVGEPVIYFEIDSILPPNDNYHYLERYNWRLKTIRLLGVLSQGLVQPINTILSLCPDIKQVIILKQNFSVKRDSGNIGLALHVGDDITELLGVQKYEIAIPAKLAGDVKGGFPHFMRKTDSHRLQNVVFVLKEYVGTEFIVCEKLDGSSSSFYYNNGEFGVCSRNLELKDTKPTVFWEMARKYDLKNKLASLRGNFSVHAECVGMGIQKNKYKLSDVQIRLFDIYDIDKQQYLDTLEAKKIADQLELPWVPVVAHYTISKTTTVDELLSMAEGASLLNTKQEREGLVFRPLKETIDPVIGRLAFKAISNNFILKHN